GQVHEPLRQPQEEIIGLCSFPFITTERRRTETSRIQDDERYSPSLLDAVCCIWPPACRVGYIEDFRHLFGENSFKMINFVVK
ncbi:MAG: hypothetical protein K2H88_01680, partial [Duncaniella sp.]|nr:hypothetical protein [Duncaniella sp.]